MFETRVTHISADVCDKLPFKECIFIYCIAGKFARAMRSFLLLLLHLLSFGLELGVCTQKQTEPFLQSVDLNNPKIAHGYIHYKRRKHRITKNTPDKSGSASSSESLWWRWSSSTSSSVSTVLSSKAKDKNALNFLSPKKKTEMAALLKKKIAEIKQQIRNIRKLIARDEKILKKSLKDTSNAQKLTRKHRH